MQNEVIQTGMLAPQNQFDHTWQVQTFLQTLLQGKTTVSDDTTQPCDQYGLSEIASVMGDDQRGNVGSLWRQIKLRFAEDSVSDQTLHLTEQQIYSLISALTAILSNPEMSNRWKSLEVVESLVILHARTAMFVLIDILKSTQRELDLRITVVEALGALQAQIAVPDLITILNDLGSHFRLRMAIARTMEALQIQTAIPDLVTILNDSGSHFRLRITAARILGALQAHVAIPDLMRILNDSGLHFRLRIAAAKALGVLRAQTAIPDLMGILKDTAIYFEFREQVACVLGTLQAQTAIPDLIAILNDSESHFHLRIAATKALVALQAQTAIPDLIVILTDSGLHFRLRIAATKALVALQAQTVIPDLMGVLKDTTASFELRGHVAHALGTLQAQIAIPDLITILNDLESHFRLRIAATKALGLLQAETAIPELIAIIQNRTLPFPLRIAVAELLGTFQTKTAIPNFDGFLRKQQVNPYLRAVATQSPENRQDQINVPSLAENPLLMIETDRLFIAVSIAQQFQSLHPSVTDHLLSDLLPIMRRETVIAEILTLDFGAKLLANPLANPIKLWTCLLAWEEILPYGDLKQQVKAARFGLNSFNDRSLEGAGEFPRQDLAKVERVVNILSGREIDTSLSSFVSELLHKVYGIEVTSRQTNSRKNRIYLTGTTRAGKELSFFYSNDKPQEIFLQLIDQEIKFIDNWLHLWLATGSFMREGDEPLTHIEISNLPDPEQPIGYGPVTGGEFQAKSDGIKASQLAHTQARITSIPESRSTMENLSILRRTEFRQKRNIPSKSPAKITSQLVDRVAYRSLRQGVNWGAVRRGPGARGMVTR